MLREKVRRLVLQTHDVRRLVNNISCVVLFVSAFSVVAALFLIGFPLFEVIRLCILIPFYIVIPGYILARTVADLNKQSQVFAYSIMLGAAMLIATYFLDELLLSHVPLSFRTGFASFLQSVGISGVAKTVENGAIAGVVAGPILSVFGLVLLLRDVKSRRIELKPRFDIRLAAMLSAAIAVSFFSIYMCLGPHIVKAGHGSIYYDVVWLISNDASVAHGWPADGFQYMGKRLNSNIMANLFRAALTRASGIPSAQMFGFYVSFIAVPATLLAVFSLAEKWAGSREKAMFVLFTFAFISFFSMAILHLFSIKRAATLAARSYFFSDMLNILYCPNGIDLAVPAACVMMSLLIDFYRRKQTLSRLAPALFASSALCTGAKYVFVVCIVLAMAGAYVCKCVQEGGIQFRRREISAFAVVALAAIIIYLGVVSGGRVYMEPTKVAPTYISQSAASQSTPAEDYTYTGYYSTLSFGASVVKSRLFTYVKGLFGFPNSMDGVLATVLIPAHYVLQQILVSVPFVCWVITNVRRFFDVRHEDLFLAGVALSGLAIYYILSVDGLSQTYFFFIASIVINMIGAVWIWDNFAYLSKRWRFLTGLCLAIGLASTVAVCYEGRVSEGIDTLLRIVRSPEAAECESDYDTITAQEFEAMCWLRDNTPEDAVIAVDRHYNRRRAKGATPEPNQPESRYYYYTAYSERQTFIGSWAYMPRSAVMQSAIVERLQANNALYSIRCTNCRAICKLNGIRYIVVSEFIHRRKDLHLPYFKQVFANEDVRIYECL